MRNWWRVAFLGLTALVIGMEVWASCDGSADTDPWTVLIVEYVPAEVTAVAIGGLTLWLLVHFGRRYFGRRYLRKHSRERTRS